MICDFVVGLIEIECEIEDLSIDEWVIFVDGGDCFVIFFVVDVFVEINWLLSVVCIVVEEVFGWINIGCFYCFRWFVDECGGRLGFGIILNGNVFGIWEWVDDYV